MTWGDFSEVSFSGFICLRKAMRPLCNTTTASNPLSTQSVHNEQRVYAMPPKAFKVKAPPSPPKIAPSSSRKRAISVTAEVLDNKRSRRSTRSTKDQEEEEDDDEGHMDHMDVDVDKPATGGRQGKKGKKGEKAAKGKRAEEKRAKEKKYVVP